MAAVEPDFVALAEESVTELLLGMCTLTPASNDRPRPNEDRLLVECAEWALEMTLISACIESAGTPRGVSARTREASRTGPTKLTVLLCLEGRPRLVVAEGDNLASLDDGGGVLVLHVTVQAGPGRTRSAPDDGREDPARHLPELGFRHENGRYLLVAAHWDRVSESVRAA